MLVYNLILSRGMKEKVSSIAKAILEINNFLKRQNKTSENISFYYDLKDIKIYKFKSFHKLKPKKNFFAI